MSGPLPFFSLGMNRLQRPSPLIPGVNRLLARQISLPPDEIEKQLWFMVCNESVMVFPFMVEPKLGVLLLPVKRFMLFIGVYAVTGGHISG